MKERLLKMCGCDQSLRKNRIIISVLIFLVLLILSGCYLQNNPKTAFIRLKGSDTMYILGEMWAAEYMKTHAGVTIYVEGGGSTTGFEAIIDGKANIAMASRLIGSREAQILGERYHSVGMMYLVAKDAMSIYTNFNNPVDGLSIHQLRDIFLGNISNWQAVGGIDDSIIVITRPPTSGTYGFFKKRVLITQEFVPDALVLNTTADINRYVAQHSGAIGYGGLAYGPSVRHIRIEGIVPIEENVRNDSYLLSRYLYLYTVNAPVGPVKDFIDWVLSPQGQRVVDRVGYIPIWPLPMEK